MDKGSSSRNPLDPPPFPNFGKFSSSDGLREYQPRWRHRTSIVFSILALRQNSATEGHTPVLSCIVVALFHMFLPVTVACFANAVCSVRFLATGLTAGLGHGCPENTFNEGAHAILNAM